MGAHQLLNQGFLGTAAPLYADLVFLLEIGIALSLALGAFLARARQYRKHARCQSAAVLLNLVVIVVVMVSSFQARVFPMLPAKLAKPYYLMSSIHAVLGISAEATALYVLLAAGTKVLPEKWRLRNYKAWMRSTLALWWSALLLGVATYVRWYVR